MINPDQSQSTAEGATAYQAGRDIHLQQGMSYQDVKQIALDVFTSNFYILSADAQREAMSRAEYITEKVIDRLRAEYPDGFLYANDPSFQHALFTVQKEHAKAGDENLGDLLVNLLVDRSKQQQRDLMQLVLDESLSTAPKLTDGQVANLAVVFILKYTAINRVNNFESFGEFLDEFILPFADQLVVSESSFAHLEFTGCGSTSVLVNTSVEELLGRTYPALFNKGMSAEEIVAAGFSEGVDARIFIRCVNESSKFQVAVMRPSIVDGVLAERGVPLHLIDLAKSVFSTNQMTPEEVQEKILEIRPGMSVVFDRWSMSGMTSLSLTTVGKAIGHANIKRVAGNCGPLEIWIN